MNTGYAERHIRALRLAKECAVLGARRRTIEYVTGLSRGEVGRFFFPDASLAPRGRPPASPEWYYSANLLSRADASIFVSIYRRIRDLGFDPAEALVSGYKHYRQVCRVQPRITFDRGFDLASHIDALWIVRTTSFSLLTCPACASQFVTAITTHTSANGECPFCKLVDRYTRDPRIQMSFPVQGLPDVKGIQAGVTMLGDLDECMNR